MDAAAARDLLQTERARLEGLIEERDDEGFGFGEGGTTVGGLNDQMGGDAATHLADRALDESIHGHLEAEIAEIDEALQRVEDGTYGICEIGGEQIPDERLEIVPATRWCVQHAEEGERQRGVTSRGTGGLSQDVEEQRRGAG
jgi:RNA polymerase-binding transcription factor DksA